MRAGGAEQPAEVDTDTDAVRNCRPKAGPSAFTSAVMSTCTPPNRKAAAASTGMFNMVASASAGIWRPAL